MTEKLFHTDPNYTWTFLRILLDLSFFRTACRNSSDGLGGRESAAL